MGSSSSSNSSVYHNTGNAIDDLRNKYSTTTFKINDYEYYALGTVLDFIDGLNPGKYWNEHWFVTLRDENGNLHVLDFSSGGIKLTQRHTALIDKERAHSLPNKYAARTRIGTSRTGSQLASELAAWNEDYCWNGHNCQDFVRWFA